MARKSDLVVTFDQLKRDASAAKSAYKRSCRRMRRHFKALEMAKCRFAEEEKAVRGVPVSGWPTSYDVAFGNKVRAAARLNEFLPEHWRLERAHVNASRALDVVAGQLATEQQRSAVTTSS